MQAQLEKEQKEDEEVYEKVWRPACFLPDDDNLGICRCVLRRSCDEVRISQNLWPFFVVPFPAIGYARVGIFTSEHCTEKGPSRPENKEAYPSNLYSVSFLKK